MELFGDWNENQILQGKWVFPNGTIYEGQFKNNKPNGIGIDYQYYYLNN